MGDICKSRGPPTLRIIRRARVRCLRPDCRVWLFLPTGAHTNDVLDVRGMENGKLIRSRRVGKGRRVDLHGLIVGTMTRRKRIARLRRARALTEQRLGRAEAQVIGLKVTLATIESAPKDYAKRRWVRY